MYNLYNSVTVTCRCINDRILLGNFGISLRKDMPFTRDIISKVQVDNVEDPLSDMNDVTYSYYMHYYIQVDYSV